jgi:8-oxo-dGTP diphosphatase
MKISAGALFFYNNKILLLKPSYRNYWLFPGGMVEERESPKGACTREVREETGLDVVIGRLLCVDYLPQGSVIGIEGDMHMKHDEEITFQFFGGFLRDDQVQSIRVDGNEVSDFRFLQINHAIPLLPNYLRNRLPHCMRAIEMNMAFFIENGKIIS